jgi:ubiquitin C-terminal hydrolase
MIHEHESDPELFSSLSLNIPSKQPFTLDQCFIEMSDVHHQTDDSEWYCSDCKRLSKSITHTFLHTLPSILIVHFKRFNYDPKSYVHIDTFIDYPLILKFEQLTTPRLLEAKYDLISVCLKVGSLRGGHAYAYAKLESGEWYCFNDSSVAPIHENDVISRHAYILTYRRLEVPSAKHNLQDSHGPKTTRTNTQYYS